LRREGLSQPEAGEKLPGNRVSKRKLRPRKAKKRKKGNQRGPRHPKGKELVRDQQRGVGGGRVKYEKPKEECLFGRKGEKGCGPEGTAPFKSSPVLTPPAAPHKKDQRNLLGGIPVPGRDPIESEKKHCFTRRGWEGKKNEADPGEVLFGDGS